MPQFGIWMQQAQRFPHQRATTGWVQQTYIVASPNVPDLPSEPVLTAHAQTTTSVSARCPLALYKQEGAVSPHCDLTFLHLCNTAIGPSRSPNKNIFGQLDRGSRAAIHQPPKRSPTSSTRKDHPPPPLPRFPALSPLFLERLPLLLVNHAPTCRLRFPGSPSVPNAPSGATIPTQEPAVPPRAAQRIPLNLIKAISAPVENTLPPPLWNHGTARRG